jgi:hypothetical protein
MASEEVVESVDEPGQSKHAKCMPERACRIELDEQQHAAASVPWNGCAVSEHEPPTFAPTWWCNGREQAAGLIVS